MVGDKLTDKKLVSVPLLCDLFKRFGLLVQRNGGYSLWNTSSNTLQNGIFLKEWRKSSLWPGAFGLMGKKRKSNHI